LKVEIERTNGAQAVPKSSRAKSDRNEPSLQTSVTNGDPLTTPKASAGSTFQPYVPVLNPNKRKREPQRETREPSSNGLLEKSGDIPSVGNSEQSGETPTTNVVDDRDLKKARKKKEKKETKQRKADEDLSNGDVEAKPDQDSTDERRMKKLKKKAKKETAGLQSEVSHAVGSEHPAENDGLAPKKEKKKRDRAIVDEDDGSGKVELKITDEKLKHGKKKKTKSKVVDDTKGGVEPIDTDDHTSEQSADESQQQRLKPNPTSDSNWLRGKTSRLLDLVNDSHANDDPAPPDAIEQRPEITDDEEAETPVPAVPSQLTATSPHEEDTLANNGRLFVRNLPFTATEGEIEGLFSRYGNLSEVRTAMIDARNLM
jgi:RNA recognition motif. (a.k.a. RRM, RBD, or RNP domain)